MRCQTMPTNCSTDLHVHTFYSIFFLALSARALFNIWNTITCTNCFILKLRIRIFVTCTVKDANCFFDFSAKSYNVYPDNFQAWKLGWWFEKQLTNGPINGQCYLDMAPFPVSDQTFFRSIREIPITASYRHGPRLSSRGALLPCVTGQLS